MKKQELLARGITELKALVKKAGIKAERSWEKKDFVKALSAQKPAKAKKEKLASKVSKTKTKTKKAAAPKKPEKKKKTEKTKPTKKIAAKTKIKTAPKTAKPKAKKTKVSSKAPAKKIEKKAAKKPAIKKAVRPPKKETKKPLEELTVAELRTLAKELSITLKSGLKKADIINAINKTKAKAEKKPKPEKAKKAVTPKPAPKKIIKKAEEKVTVTKKAVKPIKKLPKALKELPEVLPKILEEKPKVSVYEEPPALPAEYGENKLASIPITPSQIYVYWEIAEDTLSNYKGSLNLRIINSGTNAFFYLPLSERIGEHFINVTPAGEYTVEIGVINYKGEFVRIIYSSPVETPVSGIAPVEISGAVTAEAGILPEEFFETPESISSY